MATERRVWGDESQRNGHGASEWMDDLDDAASVYSFSRRHGCCKLREHLPTKHDSTHSQSTMVKKLDTHGCLYLTVARIRWRAPVLKVTEREVLDGQDDIKRNALVKKTIGHLLPM